MNEGTKKVGIMDLGNSLISRVVSPEPARIRKELFHG
jgi:hypothetical protein